MNQHKTDEEIKKEILQAKRFIDVGGTYSPYKNPDHLYTVIALATQEATGQLCVIYRAEYGKKLLYVRNIDSWLEKPEVNGKKIDRFTRVKTT